MNKTRIHIIASPNGTLSAYTGKLKPDDYRCTWQELLTYKTRNPRKYILYAYDWLIKHYGL